MHYRKMPEQNQTLSILGFGCMRFPTLPGTNDIDEELSERMMLYAIEKGVNYLDVAWSYHYGESEPFIGRFLKTYQLRDRIQLATKLPSWLINSKEDMYGYFNQQLERLQTDTIDYYLVHALNTSYWAKLKKYGLFEFLDELKSSGKVRHVGFSFHDKYSIFTEIVDGYDWDFCQIQLNYMDIDYQAGMKGFQYARDKGLGIIIMEPLRGGKLVTNIPEEATELFKEQAPTWSAAEWGFRWLWNDPDIHVVLSGMSTFDQVEENIRIASQMEADTLTVNQIRAVNKIRKILLDRVKINCTGCGYCLPCPEGVAIPFCFTHYNNAFIFEDKKMAQSEYSIFIQDVAKASNCKGCGKCLEKCPQNIDIVKELATVKEYFEQ